MDRFAGVSLVLLSLFLLIWAGMVLAKPSRIKRLRFMYIYFLRWIPTGTEPTEGQIRAYAIAGILCGVSGLLAGIITLGFPG